MVVAFAAAAVRFVVGGWQAKYRSVGGKEFSCINADTFVRSMTT
jgi:hypothetical protein